MTLKLTLFFISGVKSLKASDDFLTLKRDGILVLGQEQDSLGGLFDDDQSFSGELTQVEFWTMKMDPQTIQSLSNCEQETAFVQSRVVSWNASLAEWSESNIEKRNVPLKEICSIGILQNYLIWPEQVTYPQISDYCRRLDAKLPEIGSKAELKEIHNVILKR